MELWTGALPWLKCHWPDLKSAGRFLILWPTNSGALTSLLLPHLSSSLTDSLPSLNLLYHSKTDGRYMQDGQKAVCSIPYVSVASFFPSLKQNFLAYRSFKLSWHPDCIFEIHQRWQSGFSRVYSNCCSSCSFEAEIIKLFQSSHKMYSDYILNFQESTTILNAYPKKAWKLIECPIYIYILSDDHLQEKLTIPKNPLSPCLHNTQRSTISIQHNVYLFLTDQILKLSFFYTGFHT